MRILHISDVRIGRSQSTERYRHVFSELLGALNDLGKTIDAVVILGLFEYHGRLTSTDLGLCTDFINILRRFTHNIYVVAGNTDSVIIGKIPNVSVMVNKDLIHNISVYYGVNPSAGDCMCGGLLNYTVLGGAVWAGQLIQHSFTPRGEYGYVLWEDNMHTFYPLGQLIAPEQILLRNINENLSKPLPSTIQLQKRVLGEILQNDPDIEHILRLHSELSGAEPTPKSWHITHLQFDNLFRYGSGNYLSLGDCGVIGLIGNNAIGKSSILDIILFGLFGRGLRGARDTRINIGSEQSHILIEFTADKTYKVERIDTATACKKCVFMSGETLLATGHDIYAKIEEVIGSYDEFLYTSMCYGNIQYNYTSAETQQILGDVLMIGDKRRILGALKARIKGAERELKGIPIGAETSAQVAELSLSLDNLYKIRDETVSKLANAGTILPYSKLVSELISLETEIKHLTILYNRINPLVFEVIHDAPEVTGDKKQLEIDAAAGDKLPPVCVLEYERGNICDKFQFNNECVDCIRNKNIVSKRPISAIDKDIETARKADAAKRTLKAIYNYEQSILGAKLYSTKEALVKAQNKHNDLSDQLNSEYPKLGDFLAEINKKIGSVEYNLGIQNSLLDQHKIYIESSAQWVNQLRILKKYKSVILGDLYPKIISAAMGEIITRANLILEHSAGLRIGFNDGPVIEVGARSLPIELGSGYQQFIVGLVLRAVLSRANFLIIDEGFVCADTLNAERLHLLFAILRNMFKYVLVISHLPQVQCNNDRVINIEDNNGKSYIHYGAPIRPPNSTIKCACGKIIKMSSMYSHLRSKKHLAGKIEK